MRTPPLDGFILVFAAPSLGVALGWSLIGSTAQPPGDILCTLLMVVLGWVSVREVARLYQARLGELEKSHQELKIREAQTHHLAYHDPLTGLPNRTLFNDQADKAVARARQGEPIAIVLLDLDRFKSLNDRFGHVGGDALIQEVARRLTRLLEGMGAIARLGGDEFAVLLPANDVPDGISGTLERILADLRRPYEILGHLANVRVSIGVARAQQRGADRTDLMRKADIALQRAKEDGGDCYRLFTESMDRAVQLRAALESDLRAALESGSGLSVHYQPLVEAFGRRVTGLEALLRWHHPSRGWIPPHMFIPVAEDCGLIGALGDWVLGEACTVAKDWPKLTVAVNLSPTQFCDDGFAERTGAIVRRAGIDPAQMELEVTEGIVLDTNETVRRSLRRLRREGFRIALDDFGTGYSSLSYLRDFEVDRIKIDKSFVHSLGRTLEAGAIVNAVVTLGHAMGLQVTAEGVETSDQEEFLRSAGCNLLQGFLFSRAVPAHQLRGSLIGSWQERAA